jgi:hypothetical protein
MSKSTAREVNNVKTYMAHGMVDTAARAASALVRCASSAKARNELLTVFAGWPALIQHADFIV